MKRAVVTNLACCLSVVASSGLADRPRLLPSRDVDVTYRASGIGAPPGDKGLEQRVRWQAASRIMRIDPPTPGLFVIIDYVARRMSVVRDANRSVIEMATPADTTALAGNPGTGDYLRRGEETVAGLSCTDWETHDRDGRQALVCITADGVMLRADVAGGTAVSAVSVQYAQQDPAIFNVPADYAHHAAGAVR